MSTHEDAGHFFRKTLDCLHEGLRGETSLDVQAQGEDSSVPDRFKFQCWLPYAGMFVGESVGAFR